MVASKHAQMTIWLKYILWGLPSMLSRPVNGPTVNEILLISSVSTQNICSLEGIVVFLTGSSFWVLVLYLPHLL